MRLWIPHDRLALFLWTLALAGVPGCVPLDGSLHGSFLAPNFEANGTVSNRQAADVQVAMGRSLEQRGEVVQATATYTEAVKRDPRRTDAFLRLAILNDRQSKFKESSEMYQKALALEPNNPEILADYGYSMYLQRRWAEAEMHLRRALTLKRDHARSHNNLALVLAQCERFDEALFEFRAAGCPECEAHVNLAFALTLGGRWQDARQQYELALRINPSSEPARKGMQNLNNLAARGAAVRQG